MPAVLLTGPPACGKTSAMLRLLAMLQSPPAPAPPPLRSSSHSAPLPPLPPWNVQFRPGLRVQACLGRTNEAAPTLHGFVTREERDGRGRRTGFSLLDIRSGAEMRMASLHEEEPGRAWPTVGRYVVNVPGMEESMRTGLSIADEVEGGGGGGGGGGGVVLVDEIGKMELLSKTFSSKMRRILTRSLEGDDLFTVATIADKGGGLIEEAKRMGGVELIRLTTENREEVPAILAQKILQWNTTRTVSGRGAGAAGAAGSGGGGGGGRKHRVRIASFGYKHRSEEEILK
eukprot:753812-Hanusia_phi.AAC.1